MNNKKKIVRTPGKDLRNIRKMLGNSVQEFAKSIGIAEDRLVNIETGKDTLSDTELYLICSIIMNTISKLMNDVSVCQNIEDEQRINNVRNLIVKKLSEFVGMYHPLNGQMRKEGTVSVINDDELINPNDERFDNSSRRISGVSKKRSYDRKLK